MKKIAVLLAAYNGSLWIEAQINSILQQKNVDVTIYISVDISHDNTLSLCECFASSNERIKVLGYGEKFGGAAANFYRLIKDVDFSSFDYVAFADQDDLWLDDKLEISCSFLAEYYDVYSSNVVAFWPDGRRFLIDKAQPQVKYDFLFEAAGPGCTYVIKCDVAISFKDFLVEHWPLVKNISLHDWLFYSYARINCLKWKIDSRPSMYYRQHQNNQIGANNSFSAAVKRYKLIKSKWYRGEILKLIRLFSDSLDIPFKEAILSGRYIDNIKLLRSINQLRRKRKDRLYLSISILLGIF
ncbi:glycosyltransferase [Hafnia paralvei]|jgi:rhamnosyltransferase|uniref:glycosyltransferase n=1 Tax=Hafnia paralvei TaxID=546367 RepID=UPI001584AEDE|nr:glycosyltransferase [Hafnia paralvei]MCE9909962.1 glycosyltransferase [Hafnia paralvei]NUN43090.1 glycosyltransferase [Hafnia paralvei]